ncbi:MAG TPA: class D sortase [Xanthomonadales bacterium]|nr:class D sortase [Xanthomonadales bacterium]
MTSTARTPEPRRLCALTLSCALTLAGLAAPAGAAAQQQVQEGGANAATPSRSFAWIQDPWTGETVLTSYLEPDQSLWDATQIKDYEAARKAEYPPPLGLLIIEDLNIQVPVYNGTEEHILDRGAGRIKGMARMGEDGNLGISAHRDSFFRGLKDIEMGAVILVQSAHGVEQYEVSDINIVPKDDISVLDPVDHKTLTLVTCYPFYHVGAAPQRFIVTAVPTPELPE